MRQLMRVPGSADASREHTTAGARIPIGLGLDMARGYHARTEPSMLGKTGE